VKQASYEVLLVLTWSCPVQSSPVESSEEQRETKDARRSSLLAPHHGGEIEMLVRRVAYTDCCAWES
jgi:hypothetical protein